MEARHGGWMLNILARECKIIDNWQNHCHIIHCTIYNVHYYVQRILVIHVYTFVPHKRQITEWLHIIIHFTRYILSYWDIRIYYLMTYKSQNDYISFISPFTFYLTEIFVFITSWHTNHRMTTYHSLHYLCLLFTDVYHIALSLNTLNHRVPTYHSLHYLWLFIFLAFWWLFSLYIRDVWRIKQIIKISRPQTKVTVTRCSLMQQI